MTKAELIDTIARSTDLPKKQVAATLDLAFEQIARSIRKDKRFWVPGFGTFSVRRRKRSRRLQSSHQRADDNPGGSHGRLSSRAAAKEGSLTTAASKADERDQPRDPPHDQPNSRPTVSPAPR